MIQTFYLRFTDQIQAAQKAFDNENVSELADQGLPEIEESLKEEEIADANEIDSKKYAKDFFSAMPTSLSSWRPTSPNDYRYL